MTRKTGQPSTSRLRSYNSCRISLAPGRSLTCRFCQGSRHRPWPPRGGLAHGRAPGPGGGGWGAGGGGGGGARRGGGRGGVGDGGGGLGGGGLPPPPPPFPIMGLLTF